MLDPLALLEGRVPQVLKVLLDLLEQRVHQVLKVLLDLQEKRVKAYLDLQVLKVLLDLLEQQVKACQVEMVEMAYLVRMVQLEKRAKKAILESPVKV